ncbi:MAG: ATP-dependent sacrificial sulfur transferase LarE [Lachnospiraceae bacterium]|nr:ATP-dependent sacrificial sulfur transferase LarE [Lachnospiraceae bacterium]
MTLQDFFSKYHRVAIGFSGGVDSSYLAYTAKKYAKKVLAIYYKSEFQPAFELEDAKLFCHDYQIPLKILYESVLTNSHISSNPSNRCYYCKYQIFSAIQKEALSQGFSVLLDGTNSSDSQDDRPGIKALQELSILSPLQLCGLSKERIRRLSKEAGLPCWDKPAYACLATRIPTDTPITATLLDSVEFCENILFSMGFHDFRVRIRKEYALLQISSHEYEIAVEKLERIRQLFSPYFSDVRLDPTTRKECIESFL